MLRRHKSPQVQRKGRASRVNSLQACVICRFICEAAQPGHRILALGRSNRKYGNMGR
jgi:hypothetical protein